MNGLCELFASLSKQSGRRIRFLLRGDSVPTEWGSWLVSPVNGYLEHEVYGPFPASDAISCQIALKLPVAADVQQLIAAGFQKIGNSVYERAWLSDK